MKKRIKHAYSNEVWHENDKIIKIYPMNEYNNNSPDLIEPKILKKLKREFTLEGNVLTMDYIDHEQWDDKTITYKDIDMLVLTLKEFHSLNTSGIESINYKNIYENVLKQISCDFVKETDDEINSIVYRGIEIKSSNNLTLTHNDIIWGNLLKTETEVILIDFEYADISNNIFDAISFLMRSKLEKSKSTYFLSKFNYDMKELFEGSLMYQIWVMKFFIFKYLENKNEEYYSLGKDAYKIFEKLKSKGDIFIW